MKTKRLLLATVILIFAFVSNTKAEYLTIGNSYIFSDIETTSQSGTGWAWNHTTKTLTIGSSYTLGEIMCTYTGLMTVVYNGNVSISASSDQSCISTNGSLLLSGGINDSLSLSSTGSNYFAALYAANGIEIKGGKLNVQAASTGGSAYGIHSYYSDITITDTKLTVSAAGATGAYCSIYAQSGALNISGTSIIKATLANTIFGYVLEAGTNLNISGGSIYLNNTNNRFLNFYKLNMTGGIVYYNNGTPPTLTSLLPNTGTTAGNTYITVTGSDFSDLEKIKFGKEQTFSYLINTTKVEFSTPPSTAGCVSFAVETTRGISVLPNAFTYLSTSALTTTATTGSLKVYPNPVISQLTIKNEQLKMNDIINIVDLTGKLIATYEATSEETTFDVSHLASGVYFVQVGSERVKIIKK